MPRGQELDSTLFNSQKNGGQWDRSVETTLTHGDWRSIGLAPFAGPALLAAVPTARECCSLRNENHERLKECYSVCLNSQDKNGSKPNAGEDTIRKVNGDDTIKR